MERLGGRAGDIYASHTHTQKRLVFHSFTSKVDWIRVFIFFWLLCLAESLAQPCSSKDSDVCEPICRNAGLEPQEQEWRQQGASGKDCLLTSLDSVLSYSKVIYRDFLCTNSKGDCEWEMLAGSIIECMSNPKEFAADLFGNFLSRIQSLNLCLFIKANMTS